MTRRNIQEGETAVIGTMNNAGTVLLTLADMSVIQAEVEVDETNMPFVAIGQPAKITIDALPDRTFKGHVTEIGNSPIQQTRRSGLGVASGHQLQGGRRGRRRPSPTCGPASPAPPTSRPRRGSGVTAVPIPAVAVRELVYDAAGQIVKKPRDPKRKSGTIETDRLAAELEPGQTRKETEGVFVVRDGMVEFVPIKIGIAGDRYFEVLAGCKPGDEVVTGPYNSVRGLHRRRQGQDRSRPLRRSNTARRRTTP